MRSFRVRIWNDTGVPEELIRCCENNMESVNTFVNRAIAEKLKRMDVHSMTVDEIEEAERNEREELP